MRPPEHVGKGLERELLRSGARLVAGIDEAGRGSWAGPVYAAAVVLSARNFLDGSALAGVTDSKLLTRRRREELFDRILASSEAVAVACVEARTVDKLGVGPATREAMLQALDHLPVLPDAILVDAVALPAEVEYHAAHRAFPHADLLCLSVGAASICAKVSRDRDMVRRAARYPGYGFERNMGYGTREHGEALRLLGPSPIHRRSFRPILEALTRATGKADGAAQAD